MFAVIGLGNPGPKYQGTRHNIGFEVVGELGERWQAGSPWQNKFDCLFTKVRGPGGSAEGLLILPQKFMNLSGRAAAPLLKYFKIEPADLIVVYDELDLDPGQIRVKQGGSGAGHKGVNDIVRHLGAEDFFRIRVGIGHPRRAAQALAAKLKEQADRPDSNGISVPVMEVSDWVLGHPGPEEKDLLEKSVLEAARAVEVLLDRGLEEAQREFNRKS